MLSSDELGMLKTAAKFEKNRTEADAFLKELKLCTAAALKKKSYKFAYRAYLVGFLCRARRF